MAPRYGEQDEGEVEQPGDQYAAVVHGKKRRAFFGFICLQRGI